MALLLINLRGCSLVGAFCTTTAGRKALTSSRNTFSRSVSYHSNHILNRANTRTMTGAELSTTAKSSTMSSSSTKNDEPVNKKPRLVAEHEKGSTSKDSDAKKGVTEVQNHDNVPLYRSEGLFAVKKPMNWTSQDTVGYIRKMLEKDANDRGYVDDRRKKRKPLLKIGHGGTLDPLATGVLVIGLGKGTKELQKYLTGSKRYRASVKLGIQTNTLDLDPKGHVVEEKSFDHVTSWEQIHNIVPKFSGQIKQIPPIFSALRKDGKRLHELGRAGQTADDIQIEPRDVTIHELKVLPPTTKSESESPIASFDIDVECGGGTYIRSLVRDIGLELGTVATMSALERTKQGQFVLEDSFCLSKDDWSPESITKAIEYCSKNLLTTTNDDER